MGVLALWLDQQERPQARPKTSNNDTIEQNPSLTLSIAQGQHQATMAVESVRRHTSRRARHAPAGICA